MVMDFVAMAAMWERRDPGFSVAFRRLEIAARSVTFACEPGFSEFGRVVIAVLESDRFELRAIASDLLRDLLLMPDKRHWNDVAKCGLMDHFGSVAQSVVGKPDAENWVAFVVELVCQFGENVDFIVERLPLVEYARDRNVQQQVVKFVETLALCDSLSEKSANSVVMCMECLAKHVTDETILMFVHVLSKVAKSSSLSCCLCGISDSIVDLYFRECSDRNVVLYFSVLVCYMTECASIGRVVEDIVKKALDSEFEMEKACACYCRVVRRSPSSELTQLAPLICQWILRNVDVFGPSQVAWLRYLVDVLGVSPLSFVSQNVEKLLRFLGDAVTLDTVESSSCVLMACALIFDAEAKEGRGELVGSFLESRSEWFSRVLSSDDEQLRVLAQQVAVFLDS